MKNEEFYTIIEHLPSSIRKKMDFIRTSLRSKRASIMVGAGFSLNAESVDGRKMKDWNSLVEEIYKKLYGDSPKAEDLRFTTPMKLASIFESSFGKHELNEIILNNLPDSTVIPGELHKKLVNLNWTDIFTTNYDTLLERAATDEGRPYSIVTNNDTLLSNKSPRIMKLHGSFPNQRPFITSDEDFRTYPQKFPAMINTVKQSLIENTFCMIGFSGDDPNFNQWLGWFRDVMGSIMSPVYLIVWQKELDDTTINLNRNKNIDIINLYDIPIAGQNRTTAMNFFFDYMDEKEDEQWEGLSKFSKALKSEVDIETKISRLQEIRESYPGWVFFPMYLLERFNIYYPNILFFWNLDDDNHSIDAKKLRENIHILYEIYWYFSMSSTPIFNSRFLVSLKNLLKIKEETYKELYSEDIDKLISLYVTLLSIERKNGDKEEFDKILNKIYKLRAYTNQKLDGQVRYEICLNALSHLDYEELTEQLDEWQPSSVQFIDIIHKASILLHLERESEAALLLYESYKKLKKYISASYLDNKYLQSIKIVIELLLNIINRWEVELWIDFDERYSDLSIDTMSRKLYDKMIIEPEPQYKEIHEFSIDTISSCYTNRSGYDHRFLNSYRFFAIREVSGLPLGLVGTSISTELTGVAIKSIASYYLYYAIQLVIQSAQQKYIDLVVNRENLSSAEANDLRSIFDRYITLFDNDYDRLPKAINYRLLVIVYRILGRLCVKVTQEQLLRFHQVSKKILKKNPDFNCEDALNTCYSSMNRSNLMNVFTEMIIEPIKELGINGYKLSYDAINGIRNIDFVAPNEYRKINYQIKRKAQYLPLNHIINKELIEYFESKIKNHGNENKDAEDIGNRFQIAPYDPETDKYHPGSLCKETIEEFCNTKWETNNIQKMSSYINKISGFAPLLSNDDFRKIVEIIVNFIEENTDYFSQILNERMATLAYRKQIDFVDTVINFLRIIALKFLSKEIFDDRLRAQLLILYSYGYQTLNIVSLMDIELSKGVQQEIIKQLKLDILGNDNNKASGAKSAIEEIYLNKHQCDDVIFDILKQLQFVVKHTSKHCLNLLLTLLNRNLLNEDLRRELAITLYNIHDLLLNSHMEEEYKIDIYYRANQLAGALSYFEAKEGDYSHGVKLWQSFSEDKNNFNDCRVGFEQGAYLAENQNSKENNTNNQNN